MRRASNTLPTGCIVAGGAAIVLVWGAIVAFEIWWRFTLFAAVLKYLHG